MSTKIYHGWRVHGVSSAADLVGFCARARAAFREVYDRAVTAAVVAEAVARRDEAFLAGDVWDRQKLAGEALDVLRSLRSAQAERRGRPERNGGADMSVGVAVLCDPADPGGPLYALLFTERGDYEAAWAALPGVEAWPYWDNTDPPDDVDDDEWGRRRDAWDRALGWDAPADRGASVVGVPVGADGAVRWEDGLGFDGPDDLTVDAFWRLMRWDVAGFVPSAAERARRVIGRRVEAGYPAPDAPVDGSGLMAWMRGLRDARDAAVAADGGAVEREIAGGPPLPAPAGGNEEGTT